MSRHFTRLLIVAITLFLLTAFATFLLAEAGIALLLSHPALLTGRTDTLLHEYYMNYDRKIIQVLPECARYDKELLYTLKPGRCRVKNREYNVEFRINSLGVRDDEISLDAPEVIVIGDSHAMGWGVEQEQSFSKLIEKQTGRKVLNTAVSSYGTAREVALLKRVNTDRLRYLIIQYCPNDYDENKEYVSNHDSLPVSSEDKYNASVKEHLRTTRYYLGKHTITLLRLLKKSLAEHFKGVSAPQTPEKGRNAEDEAYVFLHVLKNAPIDFRRVHIIVFEVEGSAKNNSVFINELNKKISKDKQSGALRNITAIDFSRGLTLEKYYVLDDHITAKGHLFIAQHLVRLLR